MRICHVSRGACPRIVKLAHVQQAKGHKTHWIGYTPPSYQTTLPFDSIQIIDDGRFGGIKECIDAMNGQVDVFHVHTHLYDTFIAEYVRSYAQKKVVWDCHDKGAIEMPLPKLTPTEAFGGTTYKTYIPKAWFATPKDPKFSLVIATGLSEIDGHFRNWLDTFKKLQGYGLRVRCFTNSAITKEYQEAAEVLPPIDVVDLISEMSYSLAGLCGSPHKAPIMEDAQPNKLYEYVAAGIPSICFGRDTAMAKVIETYQLGAVINKPEDIFDALEFIEREHIRDNVLEQRHRFNMESQERIVADFYERVMYG